MIEWHSFNSMRGTHHYQWEVKWISVKCQNVYLFPPGFWFYWHSQCDLSIKDRFSKAKVDGRTTKQVMKGNHNEKAINNYDSYAGVIHFDQWRIIS